MQNREMPMVIIDPKEEFAGFTWLFGGQRVVIGSDTGINPLQIEETPAKKLKEIGEEAPYRNAIRRAMDFVRSFYDYQNIPFEDKQGTWRTAIQEGYRRRGITDNPDTHDADSPTFADDVFPIFEEMVNTPENFLRDALADVELSKEEMRKTANSILQNDIGALEEGGEFEHLSQATDIDLQNVDVLYLDLQNYESETTAGLMMGPLLTAVLELAKKEDEPMALGMDEFHYMLHNSSSLETLKQGYRHSRHSDLSMITATQSVEEFFTESDDGSGQQLTESASTLTKLMSVKIWHYLEEMNEEWAGEFDMSESEQQYIDDASTGDPTAQALLQTQKEGSYRLSVNFSDKLNPREFAMNQYDPTDHGSDPLAYLDSYTNRDRDVTEWTWPDMTDSAQTAEIAGETGTELADGTRVTTDVSDVDATPTGETDSTEQPSDDSAGEEADADKSESTPSKSESEVESDGLDEDKNGDGEQSDGFTTRLKSSVSSAVSRGDGSPSDESNEEPSLTDIGTVSARTATNLHDAGFETVEGVFEAENSALAEAEGFDQTKAVFIQKQAARALGQPETAVEDPSSSAESAESEDEDDGESTTTDGEPSESHDDEQAQPALTDIQQVGEDRADVLCAAGYESVADVAEAGQSVLTDVDGIGDARADTIAASASALLSDQLDDSVADAPGGDE